MSKQQLNRLGERLARNEPPDEVDLLALNEVVRAYQAILDEVEVQLSNLDLAATTRVKTTGVLIEKLRREDNMALARVQDLAGARIVVSGGRTVQDSVVALVAGHFTDWTGKESRIVDRREKPSHGYRAVHVIVFPEGVPVEVQVRTELQNYWAQIIESLADRWGRGIRYGDPPDCPNRPAIGVRLPNRKLVTRQRVIEDLLTLSNAVNRAEQIEQDLERLDGEEREAQTARIFSEISARIPDRPTDTPQDVAKFYRKVRWIFKRSVQMLGGERRYLGRIIRRTVPILQAPTVEMVREKLQRCNYVLSDRGRQLEEELRSSNEELRGILRGLEQYVERGGIR